MTLPTMGHAHVLELRHAAATERLDRDQLAELERDSTRIRDLEAVGLLTWDGGSRGVSGTGSEHGQWVSLHPGAVVVTPAGHAALRFYDLGCQRLQADARISELEAALRDAVTGKACWLPRARELLKGAKRC